MTTAEPKIGDRVTSKKMPGYVGTVVDFDPIFRLANVVWDNYPDAGYFDFDDLNILNYESLYENTAPKCDCGGAKLRHVSHSAWCSTQPTTTAPFSFKASKRFL